jgi:hypothetical protein
VHEPQDLSEAGGCASAWFVTWFVICRRRNGELPDAGCCPRCHPAGATAGRTYPPNLKFMPKRPMWSVY